MVKFFKKINFQILQFPSNYFVLNLFILGSCLNIVERISDKIIVINGSYPDDYEFEKNTFFTETIVQTDLGMLSRERL